MKRLVSVLVSLVLMVSCFSSALAAADFTLRSGIKFGDTMEDILTKEKTLTRESEDSNWFKGKIAGYSDAQCYFKLNDDGKLIDMEYSFGSSVCSSRDEMNNVYKKLYDSLKRQYGNPLGNTGGSCELITGGAIESMIITVYAFGSLDGYSADYTDYDEWIVDCDDYHVKIDMASYYLRDKSYDYTYTVSLSYHYYTDEDYDAAVREKEGERQEVDDDL